MVRYVLAILLAVAVVVTDVDSFDEKLSSHEDTTQAKLDREANPEELIDDSATDQDFDKSPVADAESELGR